MTLKLQWLTPLAAALLFAAGSATAGDKFSDLDADDSGTIGAAEARDNQKLINQWSNLDANGDNQLDQAEFSRFEAEGSGASESKEPGASTPY